jgi:hypothetical protein
MPTTSKTYRGRYARHTYGRFAADASRALAAGWVPVSMQWADETLLDVVFERPTPVDVGGDGSHQDGRPSLWGRGDDRPEPWHRLLMLAVHIGAGVFGLMAGLLLVTTVLRG